MKAGAMPVDKSTVTGTPLVPMSLLAVVAKAGQLQGGWVDGQSDSAATEGLPGRAQTAPDATFSSLARPLCRRAGLGWLLHAGSPAGLQVPPQRDSSQPDALWSQSPQRKQGP